MLKLLAWRLLDRTVLRSLAPCKTDALTLRLCSELSPGTPIVTTSALSHNLSRRYHKCSALVH